MFGGSLGIVDPPRCMGTRFGLRRVFPLVPGFPLVGGWIGHRMSTHSGSTRCELMDPDGIVGVPTMLDEVWLVRGWVPHDRSPCHRLAVLLVDVERLIAN